MTIILDKCAHISNTIKIYLDSMYVLGVTLPMCLIFYHYIRQSCPEVVVTLVIHIINWIVNGWRPTKSVVYLIQYVRLKYKYIEYQSIDINLTVICIPIKSHQSNQTRSRTLRSFIGCGYSSFFSILWHTIPVYV